MALKISSNDLKRFQQVLSSSPRTQEFGEQSQLFAQRLQNLDENMKVLGFEATAIDVRINAVRIKITSNATKKSTKGFHIKDAKEMV